MNSLQRSSLNSFCKAEVHKDLPESGESRALNVHLHFNCSSKFIDVTSSSRLGSGESIVEMDVPPGHVIEPDADGCKEWDQLAKCERCQGA